MRGGSATAWPSNPWKAATAPPTAHPGNSRSGATIGSEQGGPSSSGARPPRSFPKGARDPRQLVIDDDHASGLEELLTRCRAAHRAAWGSDSDLIVGLQLTHSGRYSHPRPILAQHDPLLDPRTIIDKSTGARASEGYPLISDDALEVLQDRYVAAASLAYRIGFDFVDLKQCHRYLLNELLASRT